MHLQDGLVELLGYAEEDSGITLSALIGEFAGPYRVRLVRAALEEIGAHSGIIHHDGDPSRSRIAFRLPASPTT